MQQKNQKFTTSSRSENCSEGAAKQSEAKKNEKTFKNGNTFLAAATSNWYVHTMISTHEQKKSFTKSQNEQPLLPAFFEIEGEEDAIFQKNQKNFSSGGLFLFPNSIVVYDRTKKITPPATKNPRFSTVSC